MAALADWKFPYGHYDSWYVYLHDKKNRRQDLTGWNVRLTFLAADGTTFSKTSDSNSDWLVIDTTEKGKVQIIVATAPTTVVVDTEYTVGLAIEKGTKRIRYGKATWEFETPDEGAYASL